MYQGLALIHCHMTEYSMFGNLFLNFEFIKFWYSMAYFFYERKVVSEKK